MSGYEPEGGEMGLGKQGTAITDKRIRLCSCFFGMDYAIIIAIKTSKGRLKV